MAHAHLTQQELDRINQIIADYHYVLMDSTTWAWDSIVLEGVIAIGTVFGVPAPYVMDLRKFAENVTTLYTLYK